jgi:putative nucleotidyltransferase with HDIG domain
LKSWFNSYCSTFLEDKENSLFNQNIYLKINHTYRTVEVITLIGEKLKFNQVNMEIAQTIALFHDIGRFVQYQKYGTFLDSKSENHAHLSTKILRDRAVLTNLSQEDQKIILTAIECHNVAYLPSDIPEKILLFAKLIRDADKIDIYKVVSDHYNCPNDVFKDTIDLGLPSGEISEEVYQAIMTNRIIMHSEIESISDFKILQMAWVFDLNFPYSFILINERNFIQLIFQTIPRSQKADEIFEKIQNYIQKRI